MIHRGKTGGGEVFGPVKQLLTQFVVVGLCKHAEVPGRHLLSMSHY